MTLFLAIETSCDETSVALFTEDAKILANVVASQISEHRPFAGVVPEIAARSHVKNLLPVLRQALQQAGKNLQDIDCVVVHHMPGLVGALLIGVTAAKTLAWSLGKPLIAVDHVASHIYAARVAAGRDIFPCVGLVVSGGHTTLFDAKSPLELHVLGATRDDAAGEAFDKTASILGLGFPGGPAIEREAKLGDARAYNLPRGLLQDPSLDFSFSGLKTAVVYALYGPGVAAGPTPEPGPIRANLAASFQAAVVEVIALKCRKALRQTGHTRLPVGGGVIANAALRQALKDMCDKEGAELFVPPMSLCTDNAAMACQAIEYWKLQKFADWDLDANPQSRFQYVRPVKVPPAKVFSREVQE